MEVFIGIFGAILIILALWIRMLEASIAELHIKIACERAARRKLREEYEATDLFARTHVHPSQIAAEDKIVCWLCSATGQSPDGTEHGCKVCEVTGWVTKEA